MAWEREALPTFVAPMLVKAGPVPDTRGTHAHEPKLDGMRALVSVDYGVVRVRSRKRTDFTERFPELQELGRELAQRQVLLDGEIVCLGDDGKPDFARLRRRMVTGSKHAASLTETCPVAFVAFDLLHLGGESPRALPYRDRRDLLQDLVERGPAWSVMPVIDANGPELVEATRRLGLEGIVSKRLDSPYVPGHRGLWSKWKNLIVEERLVVTGYVPGSRGHLDEILVCRERNGRLVHAGRVAFGLDVASRRELRSALELLVRPGGRGEIRNVEPLLCLDVAHHGGPDGTLRDPVIRALHPRRVAG
jgi:bifunctional non-homologous end joining protein LigD